MLKIASPIPESPLQLNMGVRQLHWLRTHSSMRGLQIHDGTNEDPSADIAPGSAGCLSFDLEELLEALGPPATVAEWRVDDFDGFGESYAALTELAESHRLVPGPRFLELARKIHQVIDGEFVGLRKAADNLGDAARGTTWVVLRAIDSSWWEVWSDDPAVHAAVRASFRAVKPTTYDPPMP